MGDLAEDRVYDERAGKQLVFAGTGLGVAVVETSGDAIGRFRLVQECDVRDLAGEGGWLAVATPEDVLARAVGEDDESCASSEDSPRDEDAPDDEDAPVGEGGDDQWVETGFGPAVAVGFDAGDLLAAAPDGELGRVVDVAADPTDWLAVAEVDGAVRALDGPLVGASDGVYRFTPDGIFDVGLADVRDVSAKGVPLAATGDGLFRLGNGWLRELDDGVDVVAGVGGGDGGGSDGGRDGGGDDGGDGGDALALGHAAADDRLYEYRAGSAGGWRERTTPAGPVVDVAYGERTYALASDGTFLLDRGDEWATRALGLPEPTALATPDSKRP